MVGLDNAGKTSTIADIKGGELCKKERLISLNIHRNCSLL